MYLSRTNANSLIGKSRNSRALKSLSQALNLHSFSRATAGKSKSDLFTHTPAASTPSLYIAIELGDTIQFLSEIASKMEGTKSCTSLAREVIQQYGLRKI
jgi:hypothetical protein